MASLFQEIDDDNLFGSNLDDNLEQENDREPEEGAGEEGKAEENEETIKIKKPRKPMPKLDEARVTSAHGLPALSKMFENYRFDSRKPALENLDDFMNQMEHWAHKLYPKATFDDFIDRCEVLGHKRAVQTCLSKIRMDLPLVDEDFVPSNDSNRQQSPLAASPLPTHDSPSPSMQSPPPTHDHSFSENVQPQNAQPTTPKQLTEDQLERIRQNRLKAIDRQRQKRLLEQEANQDPMDQD